MTEVAHGEIRIETLDESALAELRRIEAEVERSMSRIDRMRAEAEIGADTSELRRDLAEAEAAIKAYERRVDAAENANAKAQRQRHLDRLRQIRDEKQAAYEAARDRQAQIKAENQELERTAKRIEVIERAERQRASVFERNEKRRADAVRQQQRDEDALARTRERNFNRDHTLALRMDRDRERTAQQIRREAEALPRLQRQYVELGRTIERLQQQRRKTTDQKATLLIDLKTSEAQARMVALREELERLGGPIDLDVDVHPGRNLGLHIRRMFMEHGLAGVAFGFGATAADSVVDGFRRRLRPSALWGVVKAGFLKIGTGLERLSEMTVRLGPFTATLRQLGFAMTALGPAIVGIVGTLGSLVAVVGAAAAGVGALGIGFLGGAIPAAIGFVAVLKPMIGELRKAFAASRSYNDAVLKYGENSTQAKTKLRELNNVLAGQSKATKQAFQDASSLSSRWNDLTKPARQRAFHVIGQALDLASKSMGMFARETDRGFAIADRGISRWIKGLKSADGQRILGHMMENFNRSLGPLLHGLGDFTAWLGKVGSVASNSLPGLTRGFSDWAARLLDSTRNTAEFKAKIHEVIDAAKSLGRFLMATGRFLISFFRPGIDAGQSLVDTMTRALNGWTRFNNSVKGQKALSDFFGNSVENTHQLFNALAPLVELFTRWAMEVTPLATAFFHGVSFVTGFVNALMRLTALRGPIAAIAATLGALWAIGRIGAATRAIGGFVAAVTGLTRLRAGLAAVEAGSGAAGVMGALFGRGGAKAAVRDVEAVTTKGGTLKTLFRDLGAGAGGAGAARGLGLLAASAARLAPNFLRVAGPIGGTIAGIYTLNRALNAIPFIRDSQQWNHEFDFQTRNWDTLKNAASSAFDAVFGKSDFMKGIEGFKDAAAATAQARDQFVQIRGAVNAVGTSLAQARINLSLTRKQLDSTREGTLEHRQALIDYSSALRSVQMYENQWNQGKAATRQAAENEVTGIKAQIDALKALGATTSRLAPFYAQLDAAQNRQAAVAANLARSYRGMTLLTGEAEQAIGRLVRMGSKSLAIRIATKFEKPGDAAAVARGAANALKSGVPTRIVTKIVADSKNAEQAIRRLASMQITDKKVRIIEQGGKEAVAMVQKILGFKLPPKIARIVQQGGPEAISVLSKILGFRFQTKNQKIVQTGAAQVIGIMGTILGIKFPTKPANVVTNASSAAGQLAGVQAAMNAIQTIKTITIFVKKVGAAITGSATGNVMSPADKDIAAMAGVADLRLPVIGKAATQMGRKVNQPTLLTGEENRTEFVIATNPAYRKSNIGYLRMAASALGVQMARRGYMPRRNAEPDNLQAVKNYNKMRTREDDQTRKIDIEQSKVHEPDTLIKQVGTDGNGDPVYDIDQGKIDAYGAQLNRIKRMYDTLIDSIMPALAAAARQAYEALSDFRRTRRHNIGRWQDAIARDQRILGQRLVGSREHQEWQKRQKDQAKQRISDNRGRIDQAVSEMDDSRQTEQGIREDQHDARFRTQEYGVERQDLMDTAASIGAKAAEEKASANPQPGGAGGAGGSSGGQPTAAETRIAALQSELALSQAGLGGRDVRTILAELVQAEQARITEAQAMLGDNLPGNDMDAYNIIEQAANAIRDLNAQLGQLSTAITGAEMISLGSARYDLFRSFSSNLAVSNQLGAALGPGTSILPPPPKFPTMPGQTPPIIAQEMPYPIGPPKSVPGYDVPFGGKAGRGDVNVTNYFPTPPADPHTWSRNLGYELQTL